LDLDVVVAQLGEHIQRRNGLSPVRRILDLYFGAWRRLSYRSNFNAGHHAYGLEIFPAR
jgi:hypothetical protein